MLTYDGSQAAEKALGLVANSLLYKGLTCHLVCLSKDAGKGQLLEVAANKLKVAGGIDIIAKKLAGKPELVVSEYQEQKGIDMTVMGAFGHTRIHDWLLGSFTAEMLTHSQKPLLLLR